MQKPGRQKKVKSPDQTSNLQESETATPTTPKLQQQQLQQHQHAAPTDTSRHLVLVVLIIIVVVAIHRRRRHEHDSRRPLSFTPVLFCMASHNGCSSRLAQGTRSRQFSQRRCGQEVGSQEEWRCVKNKPKSTANPNVCGVCVTDDLR
jgi:hypothetical protein